MCLELSILCLETLVCYSGNTYYFVIMNITLQPTESYNTVTLNGDSRKLNEAQESNSIGIQNIIARVL